MFVMIKNIFKKIFLRIRGEVDTATLVLRGMKVGANFHRMQGVLIDPGHCFLIKIGNNVTLGPRSYLLAHDASLQHPLGMTKIGLINIGNNVFVGADSIILPGVTIADNVIIGVNSVITKDIPEGSVVAGNPAKIISSYDEYVDKHKKMMSESNIFDESYKMKSINEAKKQLMIASLRDHKIGYIK